MLTLSPDGSSLPVAFLTKTVEFQAVIRDLKPVALRNSILKGFKRLVLEFNDLPAIEADQVIVMGPF